MINLQKTTDNLSYINLEDKIYEPSYYEEVTKDNNLEEDTFIW